MNEAACNHPPVAYYHPSPIVMAAPPENETQLPGQVDPQSTEATITMRHIIEVTFSINLILTLELREPIVFFTFKF